LHLREDFRLAVSRIRLQLGGTRLDSCRAIICNSRAARIVRANDPDTITSLASRSRAVVGAARLTPEHPA